MRSQNRNRLARVESLENRQLLAGDVLASLEGSLLKIEGDVLDNQIAINQAANGNVTVVGLTGTLVNGRNSVTFRNPQLNAMEVRMGGGSDTVTMRGVQLTNDLYVDLGAGNDRFNAPLSFPVNIGANATFEGGLGNDVIQLAGMSVGDSLAISGGTGVLTAQLSDLTVDQVLVVIGDDMDDLVNISRAIVGDSVSIETKVGADRVNLTDPQAYDLNVNMDANAVGADRLTMTRVTTQGDINVSTGAGDDVVRMVDVTSAKSIKVSTDAGNDFVSGTRVSAVLDAVFEGGAGIDIFEDRGSFGGVKREIKEVETFR